MFYAFKLSGFLKRLYLAAAILAIIGVIRFFVFPRYIAPEKYSLYVEKYSAEYGLDRNLVYAVIKAESNFNKDAVSRRNAAGLMQIMPQTGEWAAAKIGVENFTEDMLFLPEVSIRIGCWYLSNLQKQFGNEETALAAYNAGSGNVSDWLKEYEHSADGVTLKKIPFEETDNYVKKILFYKKIYETIY